MKQQKTLSILNGKGGFLEEVVRLTKEGCEVDVNASCRVGTAAYVLVYDDGKSEQKVQEEYKQELQEKKAKKEAQAEKQAFKDLGEPDFDKAKSFEEKDELIEYASKWDIELDKRKAFDSMVKSFRGKYYAKK